VLRWQELPAASADATMQLLAAKHQCQVAMTSSTFAQLMAASVLPVGRRAAAAQPRWCIPFVVAAGTPHHT
jgi:hypothetical protein